MSTVNQIFDIVSGLCYDKYMKNVDEMTTGLVFDIEEFAVFDGPGIRCAVFLKGCPLRCMWCHNPEGLEPHPQRVVTHSLCIHCGACRQVCQSPEHCVGCGRCVDVCPRGCIRIAGTRMTAGEVAARIRHQAPLLKMNDGGVTFSGGEVLMQADFVRAVRSLVPEVHALIETSGYSGPETFRRLAEAMDMVIMDVKIVDPALHKRYTGVDNAPILKNLEQLKQMGKPFRIRVPLIPTVNDMPENMEATARLLEGAQTLEKVELMRYNKAAGAKYSGVGLTYSVDFPEQQDPQICREPFEKRGIRVEIL